MPRRAKSVCPQPGCPELVDGAGRCPTHRRDADRRRGTAQQRGYDGAHRHGFRAVVLARDPRCRCTDTTCPTHTGRSSCERPSGVADHWPRTRRELVAAGLDANAPEHGRGVCTPCHNHTTAVDPRTAGGWNRPPRATTWPSEDRRYMHLTSVNLRAA